MHFVLLCLEQLFRCQYLDIDSLLLVINKSSKCLRESAAWKLWVLRLVVNYYDSVIYLFINLLPVLLFARKEVCIKRYFPVQFLLGKFVLAKLYSVWLKKIHKHGQNSEEKIGLIFVLAILLSELEFHKKIKKWIN